MKYKILIVLTHGFNPNSGGVQRSTYKMSSVFKKNGHETHVFTYWRKENKPQKVAKLHIADQEGAQTNPHNHNQLTNLVLSLKPDIVINQMPYDQDAGKALLKAKKEHQFLLLGCLRNTLFSIKLNIDTYIKRIVPKQFHGLTTNPIARKLFYYKHKLSHRKDLKFILDTYDFFVMFGPPNMDELKYFVGNYKLHKTHLIPNSIPSVISEIPKKEKRILWLSTVNYHQKRADLILPFWKKVLKELPDWELDIVGDGDAYDEIKQQIGNEHIPRVTMHGRQMPFEYYKRASIYIMTSAFEGLPNTLLEAQSFAAIPIVYDSYPICSWIVNNGESGILIKPFDVGQMAKEAIALVNDPTRQQLLMQASLSNAREFQLDKVGQKWMDFFAKQLKGA